MSYSKHGFLAFYLLVFTELPAQHPNIKISDVKSPNEISVAIHPHDKTKLLAAANIASVYTSADGGLSWIRSEQTSEYGVWGDPVVAIDGQGHYYHFHLSRPADGYWIDRIVCQKSIDAGKSFGNGSFTGYNPFPNKEGAKAQDKHWIAINPKDNSLYLTWTQFDKYESAVVTDRSNILFSKSDDGGESWSTAKTISSVSGDCLDDDNTVEGAVPAIGPAGEIYVSWAGPEGIVFNKSLDGGKTWMNRERKLQRLQAGWTIHIPGIYRANGLPITVCDISGQANHGTIYINYADQVTDSTDTDIFLLKSTDKGETWSRPIRVNQDHSGRHQFFTWMTIDQATGYLYFVYHDRRDHTNTLTDIYLAWSKDGGQTFEETKISETPFGPSQEYFFGDYNTISAVDGMIRPVWTRLDTSHSSVWTALVDSDLLLNDANAEVNVLVENDVLRIGQKTLPKATVSLIDLNNQLLKQYPNVAFENAEAKLNFDIKPGVYKLVLEYDEKRYARQLVVPYP